MKKLFSILLIISFFLGIGFVLTGFFNSKNPFFHGFIIIGICILLGVAVKIMDLLIDEIKIKSYRIWIIPFAILVPVSMVYLALTEEPVIGMVIGTALGILVAGKMDHPAYIASIVLFILFVVIAFRMELLIIDSKTFFIIPVAATGSFLDEYGHERWGYKKKFITFIFKHRFFLKICAFIGLILDFVQPVHLIGFLCFDIFYDIIETAYQNNAINKKSDLHRSQRGLNKGVKNA